MNLKDYKNIYFIGIGGIGLSALAQFLNEDGFYVSGSDMKSTAITDKLLSLGIKVTTPHLENNISKSIDLIVHSAIIKNDNIEIIKAKEYGIKILSRKEFLPYLLNNKKVYSVCAAHGKSTTTAILATLLDSSTLIGAESKSLKSNMRFKKGELLAFEADESDESFLNSNPYCSIVINTEPEHMEYYNYDLKRFYTAYETFLREAKIRVINAEDEFLSYLDIEAVKLYPSKDIKNIEYILKDDEPYTKFTLKDFGSFEVWGFGHHIAVDASLAILASLNELGIEHIRSNLNNYFGIKKRFDIILKKDNFIIIDDYAHHPTEIKATLESVLIYKNLKRFNNITVIWQPHKYSRTVDNLFDFKLSFNGCNNLIILPVYGAGEKIVDIDFNFEFSHYNLILAKYIKRVNDSVEVFDYDDKLITILDKELVIGFGAGDITYSLRGEF